MMSYLPNNLSQAAVCEDASMFRFLLENYNARRKTYKNVLLGIKRQIEINELSLKLEASTNQAILKSNPCYHKIPMEAFWSMASRIQPHEAESMGFDTEDGLKQQLEVLEKRSAYA